MQTSALLPPVRVEHAIFPLVPADQPVATWWTASFVILCLVFALGYVLERRLQPAVLRLARR